jgi:hypothetical protein
MHCSHRLAALLAMCILSGCGTVQKDHSTGQLKWWPFAIQGDPSLLSVADLSQIITLARRDLEPKGRDGRIFRVRIVTSDEVFVDYGVQQDFAGQYLDVKRHSGRWTIDQSVIWMI